MRNRIFALAVTCVFAFGGQAQAGGFNIYEMGARATALGGAFTATADDGSAMFFNPAGIAWFEEGWHVSANLSLIKPGQKYARPDGLVGYPGDATSESADALFTPGGLYASYRANEEWAFGFGVFTPFGLGVEWDSPDTFAGRSLATNSQIEGFYISPMVTWRPDPTFAVSVGGHAAITRLTLERIVVGGTDLETNLADFELEGTSEIGFAPAFAAMFRPNDRVSFGLNFKGGVTNSFEDQDAKLDFRTNDALDRNDLTVSGDLDFPSILMVGGRYQFTPDFAMMADVVWFGWSVFDEVALTFSDDTFDTVLEENYDDAFQFRFGAEYHLNPETDLLAGFVYDNTPQPVESVSPLLPDADRLDYSIGVTHRGFGGEWTLAYMLVDFQERDTFEGGVGQNLDGFDGTYRSIAHIPTIGYSRNF